MDDPQTLKTQQKTQTSLFPDFFVKQSHMCAYLFFYIKAVSLPDGENYV